MLRRYTATAVPPRRAARSKVRPPEPSTRPRVPPAPPTDPFNAPLYTLGALAVATTLVMATASASVAGIMAYLDVHDTAEFATRMRTWVSQSMPLLTAKIYRRPTALDSVPDDPVLLAASAPQHPSPTPTAFDHDAAQERLAEAFDKGGFGAWAEAAAKELEAEIEVERVRKLDP